MRCVSITTLGWLLTGCIATGHVHLEDPVKGKPDYQAACDYLWPQEVSAFYLPVLGIQNPGWAYYTSGAPWLEADEHSLGVWLANLIAAELASCGSTDDDTTLVDLVIYYASYELPLDGRDLLDFITVVATAGSIPVDESEGYLVCLEVRSNDRLVRHALATGRIAVNTNIWGGGRLENRGHAMVTEMLQTLTQAAWETLWIDPDLTGANGSNCADEILSTGFVSGVLKTRAGWSEWRLQQQGTVP